MIKIGRKGKFAEWLTQDGLTIIEGYARDGLTDEQTAHNMGISYTTLKDWINKYPSISAALKKGKAPVDIAVENALLKRALGYDYEETITEIEEYAGGKTKKHVRKIMKHVAPDVTAQIFWLKNRKPKQWRDRVENHISTDIEDLSPLVELLRDE